MLNYQIILGGFRKEFTFPLKTIAGHISLGCVTKEPFPYLHEKDGLNIEECVNHCKDNRYAYAGFGHYRKCFCGDEILKYVECKKGKSGCGNSSQIEIFRTSKIKLFVIWVVEERVGRKTFKGITLVTTLASHCCGSGSPFTHDNVTNYGWLSSFRLLAV